jgi:hypothetical protein
MRSYVAQMFYSILKATPGVAELQGGSNAPTAVTPMRRPNLRSISVETI